MARRRTRAQLEAYDDALADALRRAADVVKDHADHNHIAGACCLDGAVPTLGPRYYSVAGIERDPNRPNREYRLARWIVDNVKPRKTRAQKENDRG